MPNNITGFCDRNRRKLVVSICILLGIFALMAILFKTNTAHVIDEPVNRFISSFYSPQVTSIVIFITNMGSTAPIVCVCVVLLLFYKTRTVGAYASCVMLVSPVANSLLKRMFLRSRPYYGLISEVGYSFPSGHSMNNMALYLLLTVFVHIYLEDGTEKTILKILLPSIAFLIGMSRIYLGAHYFTDVIAGFSLGAVCALCPFLIGRRKYSQNQKIKTLENF